MKHELSLFMNTVANWFSMHPDMSCDRRPIIHSVKSRLKSEEHLREKIKRKYLIENTVSFPPDKLGEHVTDLAGVRVMHLHQKQFATIKKFLEAKIESGDWYQAEAKAFTWDPESADFFRSLGLVPELRDTFYTSVHYTVRPNSSSKLVCEIQIRTLFEEIWGEVDHTLNYPKNTKNRSQREQLRVLSKIVGAGSRLLDSIFLQK
jgi:ppGpp synthetase/RelA/SpoT-type nucleotidyltranferase